MPQLFLLDAAIRGLTGHFYQYAAHVLEAARRAGFTPVLATSRALAIPDVPFDVHPVFRYSFQLSREEIPGLTTLARLAEAGQLAASCLPRLRSSTPPALAESPPEPGLAFRLALRIVTRLKILSFSRDLRTLFQRRPLAGGDLVLLPSAGEIEVHGLDHFLHRSSTPARLTWHLEMHASLYRGRDPAYSHQQPTLVRGAAPFAAAVDRLRRRGVMFSTDTEELVRQYERVAGPTFAVLPIPHTSPAAERRASSACVRVCYLGDARSEKGFQHLPRVVDSVWKDLVETGRVVFTLQANDSGLRNDPPIPPARAALARRPPDRVELIRQPLKPEEYEALLHRADVVLMPYDPEAYYARSSGIMTEALAAGIPVIVPAGTWLARQFAGPVQVHIAAVRQTTSLLASIELPTGRFGTGEHERTTLDGTPASLSLAGGAWQLEVDVPPGARLLAGCLDSARRSPGVFWKVRVVCCSSSGHALARRHALVSAESSAEAWFLVPVDVGTCRLRVSFWELGEDSVAPLTGGRLELHAGREDGPGPISSVGLAWSDADDLPELVREIVDHYPHYRQTAGELAPAFFRYHSAASYLEKLLALSSEQGAVEPGQHRVRRLNELGDTRSPEGGGAPMEARP